MTASKSLRQDEFTLESGFPFSESTLQLDPKVTIPTLVKKIEELTAQVVEQDLKLIRQYLQLRQNEQQLADQTALIAEQAKEIARLREQQLTADKQLAQLRVEVSRANRELARLPEQPKLLQEPLVEYSQKRSRLISEAEVSHLLYDLFECVHHFFPAGEYFISREGFEVFTNACRLAGAMQWPVPPYSNMPPRSRFPYPPQLDADPLGPDGRGPEGNYDHTEKLAKIDFVTWLANHINWTKAGKRYFI